MLQMVRDLVEHKGHANAALLNAIRQSAAAASDPELWELLHHILLANRFWLLSVLGLPFVREDESGPAPSFDALVRRYARTQAQEAAWLDTATAADLDRTLKDPLIPNGECSVAQAFMQVCLHSHGHRAQAAKPAWTACHACLLFAIWCIRAPRPWARPMSRRAGRIGPTLSGVTIEGLKPARPRHPAASARIRQ